MFLFGEDEEFMIMQQCWKCYREEQMMSVLQRAVQISLHQPTRKEK
jgi:hypothetical protein